jgi:hypothetical protein
MVVKGVDILKMQLVGSCNLVAEHGPSAAPHWTARAFAGASLPGFVLWHCARIIDWGVHTVVRDVPELASQPQWRDKLRYEMGHGAGLSDSEADDVAAAVPAADVIAYAAALRDAISSWLETVDDAGLDDVPDLRARNQSHSRYLTPAAWEEIKGLEGVPAWQLLARPCGAHVRVHIGQLETLTQLLQLPPPIPA